MPLLRSRKRKSMVFLVTLFLSFVLLSVTRAITQINVRMTHMHSFDCNDYIFWINVVADTDTMLNLSNAAVDIDPYVCTQSKVHQEFLACVRQSVVLLQNKTVEKKSLMSLQNYLHIGLEEVCTGAFYRC